MAYTFEALEARIDGGTSGGASPAEEALFARWKALGAVHPMLFHPSYRPGDLSSVGDDELLKLTGGYAAKTREAIAETRENLADGTLSVMDLVEVPALAWQDLGVDPESVLGDAVRARYGDREADAEATRVAAEALALEVELVGSVLLGPIGGLAAGAMANGLVGGAELVADLDRYDARSVARQVAFDPELARMSRDQPDLLPVVGDLVAVGVVVATAVGVAGQVRKIVEAYRTHGDEARLTADLTSVLGRAPAERYAPKVRDPHVEIVPGGGLAAHQEVPVFGNPRLTEERAHPLDHVGLDEAALRQRLRDEVPAAGSFDTRAQAEEFVSLVLEQRKAEIDAWLTGTEPRFKATGKSLGDTGTVVTRKTGTVARGRGVLVILERVPNKGGFDYTVVTAYPTL